MNELDSLKQHHQAFLAMINEVRLLLARDEIESVAEELMEMISGLNAELMVHLTMEDRHVYPALMASEDVHVRELASQFKSEIGGLFGDFQNYRLKWSNYQQVIDDPRNFSEDTEQIFSILNQRMALEDESLYPAVTTLPI